MGRKSITKQKPKKSRPFSSADISGSSAEAIRLVNEAAEKYFVGNAQALKKLEMVENSLRDNAKVVITEHGISPTLLLGSLPVNISAGNGNGKGLKLVKDE